MKKHFLLIFGFFCLCFLCGCNIKERINNFIYTKGLDTGEIYNLSGPEMEDFTLTLPSITFSQTAKTQKYFYTWKMDKPNLSSMNNWESIINGYNEKRTKEIIMTKEDLQRQSPESIKNCLDSGLTGFEFINSDNKQVLKIIPFSSLTLKEGAKFTLTSKYIGSGLGLKFSKQQENFLQNHGRLALRPNSRFLSGIINNITYEGDGSYPSMGFTEERINNYEKIGGEGIEYRRYPYNTIFITSDLLLHIYHKLFDNSLKYFEETTGRQLFVSFTQNMFNKFSNLYANETNTEIKSYYEFLIAYRAVPYSLLLPQNQIIDEINGGKNDQNYGNLQEDLSDEQIQKLVFDRLDDIKSQLPTKYLQAIKESLQEIFKANNANSPDVLLTAFSKEFGSSSFEIKQDYTQFKPRSHYTNDSFLKTYFMAMKRFMREKLYFKDSNISKAGLIMINNIKNQELTNFNSFYGFIKKLIGEDDDVNIYDMKKFISDQNWKSDGDIINGFSGTEQDKLFTLRPQKIISTSYEIPTIGGTTEAKAKDETAGFVFFGEKFTIDSRLFDQFTAGEAEKEFEYKPRVESPLMIADNLLNLPVTTKFAKLRLEKNKKEYSITQKQIDGYDRVKNESKETVAKFNFTNSVYHKRLDSLSTLFLRTDKNEPYFMQDELYLNKFLNTFLGSYTELKHDTLLYVKQAYAEMGGGGGGDCSIRVDPPTLPVPKGYVEPNIELIDELISLTQETNKFFDDNNYKAFEDFLKFTKNIATQQLNNEKISDQDFEKLRLYYNDLYLISTPQKLIGQPQQKETRGSLIADIFTSGRYGPLYVANGRPYLLAVMINDINGSRVVVGPMFSNYEFYGEPIKGETAGRFTDQDRQNSYDSLSSKTVNDILSLPLKGIIDETK